MINSQKGISRRPGILSVLLVSLFVAIAFQTAISSQSPSRNGGVPSGPAMSRPNPPDPQLTRVEFPADTFLLPMDTKQPDATQAFGFIHAMLRNGSNVYRIIEPPDVTIKTNKSPSGDVFRGGPVLFLSSSASLISAALVAFPQVILQILTEKYVSESVFVVRTPTTILLMDGSAGKTGALLNEMKIPFTKCKATDMQAHPGMVWNYTLFIDDCMGIDNAGKWTPQIAQNLQNFTAAGNEVIYTCWALKDLQKTFPGYVSGNIGSQVTRDTTITILPDFPAQYDGPATIQIQAIWTYANPILSNISVIAKGSTYTDAMYWYYGRGIAEFFSFHPGEQSGDSKRAAITLYGNKFIHFSPQVDKGLWTNAFSNPQKIATKGTAPSPADQCLVNISVTPIQFNVSGPNNMYVNFKLFAPIDNVTGSFRDELGAARNPTITVNPDNTKSLRWHIAAWSSGVPWIVLFSVTCSQPGTGITINDWLESNVTYKDDFGRNKFELLSEITIDVANGYIAPEYMPLPAALSFAAVFAVIAFAVSRRREE